jgi:hypothetical protein
VLMQSKNLGASSLVEEKRKSISKNNASSGVKRQLMTSPNQIVDTLDTGSAQDRFLEVDLD